MVPRNEALTRRADAPQTVFIPSNGGRIRSGGAKQLIQTPGDVCPPPLFHECLEVSYSRGVPSSCWELHLNVHVQRGDTRIALGSVALPLEPLCAAEGTTRALSLPLDTGDAPAVLRVLARLDALPSGATGASWAQPQPALRDGAGRTASDVSDASCDWPLAGDEGGSSRSARFAAALFGRSSAVKRPRSPTEPRGSPPTKSRSWWHRRGGRDASAAASLLPSPEASESSSPPGGAAVPATPTCSEGSLAAIEADLFRKTLVAALVSSGAAQAQR